MGLSNENPNPQTQVSEAYTFELDSMAAARLASKLIQFTHNPDPREARNPAHPGATRVRRIAPEPEPWVDQECQDHNSAVSSHGARGRYAR